MNKELDNLRDLVFPDGKLFPKVVISPEEFSFQVKKVFSEMSEILIKKNQMYGNSSMDLGLVGIYIHEHDKVMRLRSILERTSSGEVLHFEGIEDTLRDMIGYAVLGLTVFEALKNNIPAENASKPEKLPVLPRDALIGREPGTSFAQRFDQETAEEQTEGRR